MTSRAVSVESDTEPEDGSAADTRRADEETPEPAIDVGTASPTTLAQELLVATKRGEDTEPYEAALANLDDADLEAVRADRNTALAFWINLYNAGTQLLLRDRPELYESSLRFFRFFHAPAVTVAGTELSLDRIENGLLRGRSKYGLGSVPKLLVTSFESRHTVESLDPRIHFALNCGAESCPPIRAYEPENIDAQLDLATRSYLDTELEYDAESNTVRVPRVFLWFPGDFGGPSGIRSFLHEHDSVPEDASPKIRFQSWDWSKDENKFVEA